jgi:DNA-binding transcriptional regulator YiaG
MKNNKCETCKNTLEEVVQDFATGITNPFSGQEIVVPKVKAVVCRSCDTSELTSSESERIDQYIAKETRYNLSPSEIKLIRESLPCNTKHEAANFLLLNQKAFIKWEAGYSEQNQAYDLLLRLAAFDKRNINFIQYLHKKNFAFDPTDYQLVCEKYGHAWDYPKFSLVTVSTFPKPEAAQEVRPSPEGDEYSDSSTVRGSAGAENDDELDEAAS